MPWSGWSTRTRLIAVVLLIDLLAAVTSCAVVVLNARTAVRVETRASLATVESLVADTIRLSDVASPETLLQALDLRFRVLQSDGSVRWLSTVGHALTGEDGGTEQIVGFTMPSP